MDPKVRTCQATGKMAKSILIFFLSGRGRRKIWRGARLELSHFFPSWNRRAASHWGTVALLVPDALAAIALKHPDGFFSFREEHRPHQFNLVITSSADSD